MSELFGIKKVGPNRYREDPGRYFEDFNVGDIYEHWPGRTITETDNIWFTNLTMNTHPVHFDANYASKTEFKRYLVNSAFTLSLVTGMCVSGTSQKAIANLGWEEIKLPAPVFVPDPSYLDLSTTRTLTGFLIFAFDFGFDFLRVAINVA